MRRILTLLFVPVIVIVAGCEVLDPYVYKEDEFDRSSDTFFVVPTDIDGLTICYTPLKTDSPTLYAMADETCGQYGKVALFDGEGAGSCPLLLPVEAIYKCVIP